MTALPSLRTCGGTYVCMYVCGRGEEYEYVTTRVHLLQNDFARLCTQTLCAGSSSQQVYSKYSEEVFTLLPVPDLDICWLDSRGPRPRLGVP